MSCQVGASRIVKMGFDYGTVSLLSTINLDEQYKQELLAKDIKLNTHELVAHTPLANNYLVNTIQDIAKNEIVVMFTHPFAIQVVYRILNGLTVNWDILVTSLDAYSEAIKYFPDNCLNYIADDAKLGNNIINKFPNQKDIYLFGNNKTPAYYPLLLKSLGLVLQEIMVYQSTIKASTIDVAFQGILFFDELSVDSFFMFNELPQNVIAFCLNESIANHLTKNLAKPTVVVQASQPTILSMIESIIVYYNR